MSANVVEEDCEFGSVPNEVVDWLLARRFLTNQDCSMNVACGRGGFAVPMSRAVRVLVCMDTDRSALDLTGKRCIGGCRTELFEKDWNSYVPSRGKYDSCLISPSYLCFSRDSILRMESVSSRSCIAVFPTVFDYRNLRKAIIHSTGAKVSFPGFPDYRPFIAWLADQGRNYMTRSFESNQDCSASLLRDCLVRDCIARGVPSDGLEAIVERMTAPIVKGDRARCRFEARVIAWNVEG